MPIDPSIISGIKQYQAPNLLGMANEAAQVQAAQNQNQLARLQLAKAQQDQENQNMLNAAYASEDPVAFLKQRGAGSLVPGVVESQAKIQKAQLEATAAQSQEVDRLLAEVTRFQNAGQAQAKLGSLFSEGKIDQATYDNWSNVLASNPYEVAQPMMLNALGSIKERIDAQMPKKLDTKEIVVGGRVKLVDMQTGKTIQDLGEAPRTAAQISASQAGDTGITVAERNKREAALPKAKAAFDASNEDIDLLITDLTTLSNHDGLKLITGARAGTGLAKGVTTVASQDAADAQALLNNIIAKGTLRSLVNLRNNSPTGGALGNVSDADVRLLKDSFAKLDTTQATKTFQNSLNDILDQLSSTKTRLKDAFDETYSYRSQNAPAASADTTNVSAKAPKIGDIVKGYKFKGGDPANQNSWEKVK
jgi:hypothetical protein